MSPDATSTLLFEQFLKRGFFFLNLFGGYRWRRGFLRGELYSIRMAVCSHCLKFASQPCCKCVMSVLSGNTVEFHWVVSVLKRLGQALSVSQRYKVLGLKCVIFIPLQVTFPSGAAVALAPSCSLMQQHHLSVQRHVCFLNRCHNRHSHTKPFLFFLKTPINAVVLLSLWRAKRGGLWSKTRFLPL